jgi:uncharacterized protein (UPF0332 family)
VNPEEFIEFAEVILNAHHQRASYRSAISRAYYGAFHAAAQLLAELGLTTDASHGHLQHDYSNAKSSLGDLIGSRLGELYNWRVEADYRLLKPRAERPAQAADSIRSAKKILELTQQLRADLQDAGARQTFIAAVTAYRQKVNRRV